jgi:hypothetical protein
MKLDGSHGEWRYALAHNMNEIPALLEDSAARPATVAGSLPDELV